MDAYINQIFSNFMKKLSLPILELEEATKEDNAEAKQQLSKEIDKELHELLSILQKTNRKEIPINFLCTQLLSIYKNNDIPSLNVLFDTYHYLDKIENIISKVIKKKKLSLEEEIYVVYYTQKQMNISYINLLFDQSILQCLSRKAKISYSLFQSLFIEQIKLLLPGKKLYIEDLDKKLLGSCGKDYIRMNKSHLKELYEGKSIIPILTIYHEMRHQGQKEMMKHPKNLFTLQMIKEDVLIYYLKDYYDENYNKVIIENDAESFSIQFFLIYCEKIGIRIEKNFKTI